jgi:hypothetical protein
MKLKLKNLFNLPPQNTSLKGDYKMAQNFKRTIDRLIRGFFKIGDRRKAPRNETGFRRRAYDPV